MKDLNCIFCKYFNDKEGCKQIILLSMYGKTVWRCPTITNYYYGKMIYHFPFNIIFKIQRFIWEKRADKEYNEKGGNL